MISVVVNAYDNQRYLIRCLNSIKRQIYKDIEIIIVAKEAPETLPKDIDAKICIGQQANKCEFLKKAVGMARGEYVFFISSDSMMTDNTLEELFKISGNSYICSYTRAYTPKGKDYILDKKIYSSICGKLFFRERLKSVIDGNIREELSGEFEVVVEYLNQCDNIVLAEEAMIYESNEDNLIKAIALKESNISCWKKLFQSLAEKCTSNEIRDYVRVGIEEVISVTGSDSEELMHCAEEIVHDDVWLNYYISNITIKKWWNMLQNTQNHKAYKSYIKYISLFDGELVAKMLLKDCGIDESIFEVMKKNEHTVFLEILEKIKADAGCTVNRVVVQEAVSTEQYSYELSGVQLSDFVIDKYKNGNLGLKTILKSLKAWIKYKI